MIGERRSAGLAPRDVTPEDVYLNRREFLARLGLAAAALALPPLAFAKDYAGGEKPNPIEDVTTYNNFYEFGSSKTDPRKNAHALKTRPWSVTLDGLCRKPKTWDVDALLKAFPQEERIYRLRCVEAWSVVVPWLGFPLGALLKRAEPMASARFVAFQTLLDPKQMPWQESDLLPWPYREGLRLDEAMHPLTLMASGMYGKPLPSQNGAPIRLVVPWKYGFKSIKSVVRISFVDRQPATTWNQFAPGEYGFYSNVNPNVDHPRWTQKSERRLGELRRRKTAMFNGYADQVAHLYAGMDLKKNY